MDFDSYFRKSSTVNNKYDADKLLSGLWMYLSIMGDYYYSEEEI